jgi:hypothetical protein
MAVAGTAVGAFDNTTRHWQVTLAGVTAGNTSPVFTGKGYQIGSFTITGATAANFQASDDGVNFFNVGTAIAASPTSGIIAAPAETVGVFKFYQLQVTTGTGAGVVDFVSSNAS